MVVSCLPLAGDGALRHIEGVLEELIAYANRGQSLASFENAGESGIHSLPM